MHFLGVVLQQLLDGLARTVRWSVHSVAVEKEGALQYIGIPNFVGLVAGSFEDLLLHYQFKQLKEAQEELTIVLSLLPLTLIRLDNVHGCLNCTLCVC